MSKYDPNRGSKAFSYFSVITKNWFIHNVKKVNKQRKKEVLFENLSNELEQVYMSTVNDYEKIRADREFWQLLSEQVDIWIKTERSVNNKSNEMLVLRAIQELFRDPKEIEILNKKAIYLYLRELTGLKTKQIAVCLKKFRVRYKSFKSDWNEGKI